MKGRKTISRDKKSYFTTLFGITLGVAGGLGVILHSALTVGHDKYDLVFADDFEGDSLNQSHWRIEERVGGGESVSPSSSHLLAVQRLTATLRRTTSTGSPTTTAMSPTATSGWCRLSRTKRCCQRITRALPSTGLTSSLFFDDADPFAVTQPPQLDFLATRQRLLVAGSGRLLHRGGR